MFTSSVKITRKGQVTIPKEIRAKLNSNAVYFEMKDNDIIIRPVKDAAGSLSEYARSAKPKASMRQIRENAWEEAVREKTGKKSA